MTTIYVDENFAPQLAKGLDTFQQHLNGAEKFRYTVVPLSDRFGVGALDEDWIPIAGKEGSVVLTQDLAIQSTRQYRELYNSYGLGVFFFKPPSKTGYSFWDMVKQVIRRWEDIKQKSGRTTKPFAFRCTSRTDFEELD